MYRGPVFISGASAALGFGLFALAAYVAWSEQDFVILIPATVVGGLFGIGGVLGIRSRLRIFEEGVEGRGVFAPARFVPFGEATAMQWARREKARGRGSVPNRQTEPFVVHARVHGTHGSTAFIVSSPADAPALVQVRDRLCEAIVQKALEALWRGEAFEWAGVSMRLEGLRRENGTVIPYSTPFREDTDGQRYTLAIAGSGDGETVFTTKNGALNFYPGWRLFHRLASKVESSPPIVPAARPG